MSVIRQGLSKLNKTPNVFINSSRSAAYWNKDFMPGPYPVTPEQRAAAAKKYNLLPEEYEPDPDGFGDYPKLPLISGASKDPHYNWDHPENRRDHGETMHTLENIIGQDRWDVNDPEKQYVSPRVQVLSFFGVLLAIGIPFLFGPEIKITLPHMRRQYGAEGPHYKYPE